MKSFQEMLVQIKHFVPSHYNSTMDEIIWAKKCKCGSELDENKNCIALKEQNQAREDND